MASRSAKLADVAIATLIAASPLPARRAALSKPADHAGDPAAARRHQHIMARVIADKISDALGQQVVIDNRGGGSGSIGTRQVAKSAPDGYTILLGYTAQRSPSARPCSQRGLRSAQGFRRHRPDRIGAERARWCILRRRPQRRRPDRKIAKASSEPFQVGSPGIGTVNHLAAELFAQHAGVKVQHIPYKGSGPLNHRSARRPRQGRLHRSRPRAARSSRADPRAGGTR